MVTYTPAPGFSGWDSFSFTATTPMRLRAGRGPRRGQTSNDGPVCVIVVGPRLQMTPDVTEDIVLACDNLMAEVVLDGTSRAIRTPVR